MFWCRSPLDSKHPLFQDRHQSDQTNDRTSGVLDQCTKSYCNPDEKSCCFCTDRGYSFPAVFIPPCRNLDCPARSNLVKSGKRQPASRRVYQDSGATSGTSDPLETANSVYLTVSLILWTTRTNISFVQPSSWVSGKAAGFATWLAMGAEAENFLSHLQNAAHRRSRLHFQTEPLQAGGLVFHHLKKGFLSLSFYHFLVHF